VYIRHVKVANFRGIKNLVWTPSEGLVCLVGHGDATKTTILDAIELALAGRFNQTVSDADFFQFDTSSPVAVEVSVSGVPDEFLTEGRYGLLQRAWDAATGTLHDEPGTAFEPVLTIRFQADKAMEPNWTVINDRDPDGKTFHSSDRAKLCVMRIGADVNRHLSWGRGSALTRATEGDERMREVLSDAGRQARDSIAGADMPVLKDAALKAQVAATDIGAIVRSSYAPGLGLWSGQTAGIIGLHDGPVPITSSGLGSRRLVAIAIETLAVKAGGVLLIDEIETGLEPHRLRHLMNKLRGMGCGQVFFTTHSTVALIELNARDVNLVRCTGGTVTVVAGTEDLQEVLRSMPEAFLSHRVLVAEGRTEVGLTRAFEPLWETDRGRPLTHTGGVVVDGGGSNAKVRAGALSRLGFEVAMFLDADVAHAAPDTAWQESTKVKVFPWADGMCTEERIMSDLRAPTLQGVLQLAIDENGPARVLANCQAEHALSAVQTLTVADWLAAGITEPDVRAALGQAAKKGDWFKRIDRGEALGHLLAEQWVTIAATPLGHGLASLATWLYAPE
jgi:hypothetical protein